MTRRGVRALAMRWVVAPIALGIVVPVVGAGEWVMGRLLAFVFTHFKHDGPRHLGIVLIMLVPAENRGIYEGRITQALDLLAACAPTHLRWLRRRFRLIFVRRVVGKRRVQFWWTGGWMRISPTALYPHTPVEIAIEFANIAAEGRLPHPLRATTLEEKVRTEYLLLRNAVWVAERIPGADDQVTRTRKRLAVAASHPRFAGVVTGHHSQEDA